MTEVALERITLLPVRYLKTLQDDVSRKQESKSPDCSPATPKN